ncbi:hypothetical protein BJX65DRAFT_289668 [Aspergillus insuetus]
MLTRCFSIIFIHGLTGDRDKTWTAPGTTTPWPESLLPATIPNARVLTFGYDAYVTDWLNVVSISRVGNHAMNLITALATWREQDDTNERPVLFVCHSLGGIVCQDAITTSQQYPEPHMQGLAKCIAGIIFLGTPHGGSGLAQGAEKLARAINLIKQTNPNILSVLERESEVLARIQNSFHAFIRSKLVTDGKAVEITSFYEELPLPGIGLVVPLQSAIIRGYPSIGIHATHMGVTKFDTNNDAGFVAIVGELRRWTRQIDTDAGSYTVKDAPRETPVTSCRDAAEDGPKRIDHHTDWKDNANPRILRRLEMPLGRNIPHLCFLYVASVLEYPGYVKVGLTNDPLRRFSESNLTLSDIYTYQTVGYIVQRVEALTIASLRSQAHQVAMEKVQRHQGARERVREIELYKVDLDKARHVMDRWLTLFDPRTSPPLYDNEGNLIEFWHKRAERIANCARETERTFDSHTKLWDALLFSPTMIESYLQPQQ